MTYRLSHSHLISRVLTLGLVAALAMLLACGYSPESEAYDTAANPERFPAAALQLVDRFQAATLKSSAEITATFGDLYTSHPELLDNQVWAGVVEKLGVRIRLMADARSAEGLAGYSEAAALYSLAAMARPIDRHVQQRDKLFRTWREALEDSVVTRSLVDAAEIPSVPDQLVLLKYFLLRDTVHREFAQTYLLPTVYARVRLEESLGATTARRLSPSDRCFLAYLDVVESYDPPVLASFTEPRVDLLAAQIVREHGDWYAAELYFMPREKLLTDFTVALQMVNADSSVSGVVSGLLAFDFHPDNATSTWKPGEIAPAFRRFRYAGPPQPVKVGLYERRADIMRYLRLEQTGKELLELPANIFVAR